MGPRTATHAAYVNTNSTRTHAETHVQAMHTHITHSTSPRAARSQPLMQT